MKQTAVDWLADQIENFNCMKLGLIPSNIIEQAKEIEKQQIKEAYQIIDLDIQHEDVGEINSEQYYKETYEQDDDI
jgi:3-isopropylmalate dehydratase small subunit